MDTRLKSEARRAAEHLGAHAESRAVTALEARGWVVLDRRARTALGELDLVAEREGLLAFIEVKARPSLEEAAFALSPRQKARIMAAAEAWLTAHPGHGSAGMRFDVILVAPTGLRRIRDAFRGWD
ncbi:YraN family protein [Roseomonas sp. SSH11]|uniref:UPF0102 protein J8J14_22300 n=1 Tax=Pararoseomonas baculiformis TaxID=2820812 RepID=A0ABS4AKG4_9PROT|nr:YraN family protein [Pararoseomonas baculiformis]MBP0447496.1 YraN family protein [Pararoseomonas baculiformis]